MSIEIEINGRKPLKNSNYLEVHSARQGQCIGGEYAHTNTNAASAMEVENYAYETDEKHYMALFALLNEENSLGNPAVFNIAMQITIDYISGMEATDPRVAQAVKMLNALFGNQASVSEFKNTFPNPVEQSEVYMSETVKMSNKFGYY